MADVTAHIQIEKTDDVTAHIQIEKTDDVVVLTGAYPYVLTVIEANTATSLDLVVRVGGGFSANAAKIADHFEGMASTIRKALDKEHAATLEDEVQR